MKPTVKVELDNEQYNTLLVLVRTKAREIWNWGSALETKYRDPEYNRVRSVLTAIEKAKELE